MFIAALCGVAVWTADGQAVMCQDVRGRLRAGESAIGRAPGGAAHRRWRPCWPKDDRGPPLLELAVIYHGVDIIEVARIRHAAERWGMRFLRRVFTPAELADCGVGGPAPRYESLAARWAAKEATAKALGAGLRGLGGSPTGLRFQEIEVIRGPDGRPALRLSGAAAAAAAQVGLGSLALSLSHTHDHAVASVIGLRAWPQYFT